MVATTENNLEHVKEIKDQIVAKVKKTYACNIEPTLQLSMITKLEAGYQISS